MLKEFKEFAVKGNVIDLAVGVIIGAAFGKIVTAFVEDIIMPLIGMLTGGINFADKFILLSTAKGTAFASLADAKKAGAAVLAYGDFINVVLNFLIIAFVIFLMVRQINRLKREPAPAVPNTKDCPFCTTPIALAATRCPQCTSQLSETA
ncbi:MAG: Large-conductance mechanosensitive channel [Chthonomonadales bacterium]|nr:Large-conductance mechanosensitive channel [Chthonomonadales bacterium]